MSENLHWLLITQLIDYYRLSNPCFDILRDSQNHHQNFQPVIVVKCFNHREPEVVKVFHKYTGVFRNPKGIFFNTVKTTDTPLSFKLMQRCSIEVMGCISPHTPTAVRLYWWNRQLS